MDNLCIQGIGAIFGQPEVSGIAGLCSTAFSAAASFSGENSNQPNIQVAVVGLECQSARKFFQVSASNSFQLRELGQGV